MQTSVSEREASGRIHREAVPSLPYSAVAGASQPGRGPIAPADPGRMDQRRGTASDDVELMELDRAALALQARVCHVCHRIFVLTPLFLMLLASVVSAVLNWQRHEQAKNEVRWSFARCLVVETRTVADPRSESFVLPSDKAWRAEVIVRDYSTEIDSNAGAVATFDVDGLYQQSQDRAEAQLSGIVKGAFLRLSGSSPCADGVR